MYNSLGAMTEFSTSTEACPHMQGGHLGKIPLMHDVVHRDECAYCCQQSHQADGIYVCMSCFTGVCKSHLTKHLQARQGHCFYSRIKELPAVSPRVEETKDVRTLCSIPHIEYESDVVCAACCTRFEIIVGEGKKLPESVYNSFNAILNAPIPGSISVQENMMGFQLLQCSHLLTLQQNRNSLTDGYLPLSSDGVFRCSEGDCNCTENFWLCLTCGYIGCSRVESGGNGHAKDHNASTSHPCTVKLGTITPHGADVYCYACDDMVKDANLAGHMQFFGIDISVAKKTAKTMGELEYDYSTSFDFNLITEAGENLQIVYGPGKTGIENIGNSCYISCVLQCLMRLPFFQRAFYLMSESSHQVKCKSNPYDCHHCQIERMGDGLCSGKYGFPGSRRAQKASETSESDNLNVRGVSPRLFKNVFAGNHPDFSTGAQQDAHEYLLFFLDQLQKHVVLPPELQDQIPSSGEFVHPSCQFRFQLLNCMECVRCHQVRYRREEDACLSVTPPITKDERISSAFSAEPATSTINRPSFDLQACLDATFEMGSVECRCEFCGQPTTYQNTLRLETLPNVLVLFIRRDYFDPITLNVKKIDVFVHVPEEIDLERYRAKPLGSAVSLQQNPFSFAEDHDGTQEHTAAKDIPESSMQVSDESLAVIMSMGFTSKNAAFALQKNEGNLEQALNYLLTVNVDEIIANEKEKDFSPQSKENNVRNPRVFTDGSCKYNLVGMISHVGASAKTGHYVCHIRDRETNDWLLFNDEKVGISHKPPFSLGSLYFFLRA